MCVREIEMAREREIDVKIRGQYMLRYGMEGAHMCGWTTSLQVRFMEWQKAH